MTVYSANFDGARYAARAPYGAARRGLARWRALRWGTAEWLSRGRQRSVRGGRVIAHKVKVLADQEARLQGLAAEQGVSVSRLLVESALAGDGWTSAQRRELVRQLLAARRDLAGLATNVNQLARWANTVERFPRDAAERVSRIDEAIARLERAVAGLEAA